MRALFLIALIFVIGSCLKAKTNLDSLYAVWQDDTQADTTRLKALHAFTVHGYLFSRPDSAFHYAQQGYEFAQSKGLKKYMADALHNQGISFYLRGNYPQSLKYFQTSLAIGEELGERMRIAILLGNIAMIYETQGNYAQALEYYQTSLTMLKELDNKKEMSRTLFNMGNVYAAQGNYAQALEYYQIRLETEEELGDKNVIARTLGSIANLYVDLGNYPQALEYYQTILAILEELGDKDLIARTLNNIGNFYKELGNYEQALEYYQASLAMKEEFGDKQGIAGTLNNIGLNYVELGNYEQALEYYQASLAIGEELGDKNVIATTLNNIGIVFRKQGNYGQAIEYYQKSLAMKEELGDKRGIAVSLSSIGKVCHEQGNYLRALKSCKSGLELAESIGSLEPQLDACRCLYDTYKAMGKGNNALLYLEKIRVIEDSLQIGATNKKLQQMEFAKEMLADSIAKAEEARLVQEAHEEEMRKKEQTRNWLMGGGLFALLLAGGFYSRWRYVRKSKVIIEKERDRSDNLLLNILPEEIAQELKEKGKADARDFEMVSILFTDFKDFTEQSAKLSAAELVREINHCFEAFDGIIEKYKVEKIKTIGDAYMAAGGLPVPSNDSVKNTILAALEMQQYLLARSQELMARNQPHFEMRVGIHTGPVVAGIVGVKKFQYDIWGDTVNTASRIESSGEVGKVNISQATYELLKSDPDFAFESRGKIEAKGKGEMEMYFVALA